MRQGQQNRRGRGRNNNNRKGQSPLTRSFESTGPEVKIRGTPSHIAEKYMTLARDATTSGDPVLAENYLQHAEHYNRIIMAFRDQQIANGGPEMNGGVARVDGGDDYGDDDGDDGDMQPMHQPQMRNEHQPRMDNQRYEGNRGSQDQSRHRGDRDHHRNNNNNNNNNNRNDRNDRGGDRNEPRFDRGGGEPNGGQQAPRPQNAEQGGAPRQGGGGEQLRRRDSFPQQQHEQPEFLRRPVRRPRREGGNGAPDEVNGAAGADEPDRD